MIEIEWSIKNPALKLIKIQFMTMCVIKSSLWISWIYLNYTYMNHFFVDYIIINDITIISSFYLVQKSWMVCLSIHVWCQQHYHHHHSCCEYHLKYSSSQKTCVWLTFVMVYILYKYHFSQYIFLNIPLIRCAQIYSFGFYHFP